MDNIPQDPTSNKPALLQQQPATDPNVVLVTAMFESVAKAMTEPEKIKAEQETQRAKVFAGLANRALICGTILLMMILGLATYAFASGEKQLLGQAFSGVFGFLAGLGFSKFFGPQKA